MGRPERLIASKMNVILNPAQLIRHAAQAYQLRLVDNEEELQAVQTLRFAVFNLELHEGLEESFQTGRDEDPFDAVCDHLLVEHVPSGAVVGTYRLQTGLRAAQNRGYYSEQEFEFAPFESVRPEIIELGRACVERTHRNMIVLGLLWKGIAQYAAQHRARYLIGCSSLTSQDASLGASAYANLCRKHLAPLGWRTQPKPPYECPLDQWAENAPPVPKLLRAYLTLGAKICGPPALDRQFKTIDFLTLLDLQQLPSIVRTRLGLSD
jgi:putative hemolysin